MPVLHREGNYEMTTSATDMPASSLFLTSYNYPNVDQKDTILIRRAIDVDRLALTLHIINFWPLKACKVALSYLFYADLLCRINTRVGRRPSDVRDGRQSAVRSGAEKRCPSRVSTARHDGPSRRLVCRGL